MGRKESGARVHEPEQRVLLWREEMSLFVRTHKCIKFECVFGLVT
jgi:hypothetical protein